MSTRKEPVALRDGATPPPPLRRGRGLRLSTETARQEPQKSPAGSRRKASAVQAEPAAADTAQAKAVEQPAVRDLAAPDVPASVTESIDTVPEAQEPERRKREFSLRKDLLKGCKRIARAQNRKLSQVIESALEEYIQHHGAPE